MLSHRSMGWAGQLPSARQGDATGDRMRGFEGPAAAAPRRLAMMFVLALAPALAGCDSHEEEAPPMAPPSVTVTKAVRQEVTDWDEFTGRFVSTERIELRARV